MLVARQFPGPVALQILNCDPYAFVPEWSLFAPLPVSSDLYLVVRTFDANGIPGEWTELRGPVPRRWFHSVIYPSFRRSKALLIAGVLLVSTYGPIATGALLAFGGTVLIKISDPQGTEAADDLMVATTPVWLL